MKNTTAFNDQFETIDHLNAKYQMSKDLQEMELDIKRIKAEFDLAMQKEHLEQAYRAQREERMVAWMYDNPEVMEQFNIDDAEWILKS